MWTSRMTSPQLSTSSSHAAAGYHVGSCRWFFPQQRKCHKLLNQRERNHVGFLPTVIIWVTARTCWPGPCLSGPKAVRASLFGVGCTEVRRMVARAELFEYHVKSKYRKAWSTFWQDFGHGSRCFNWQTTQAYTQLITSVQELSRIIKNL